MLLAACGFDEHGFLTAAGPVAQAQREHFFSIIGWTLIVIVPLFVATPIVLWKYRFGRQRGAYRPNWSYSLLLEWLIWGLPLVIVGVLGWNLWQVSARLDPYDPIPSDNPALHIQVVGLDWKWLFIYPEQDVAVAGKLVLPVDRPIRFSLTSATVMQSFMIPRLGSQMYAMGGMISQLHLLAAEPGRYRGLNTQYNGKGFAKQQFTTHAVSSAEFKAWVHRLRSGPSLDMAAYKQLAKPSVLEQPETYGGVAPGLFQQIVTRVQNTPAAKLMSTPYPVPEKKREPAL
ncbi:MAG: COX aromatic rich motif-containing protein [Sinobacteraceae bacterium]|nr:COX aromatic rich motif-containing protein [Nevskiaceae bacterium]